MSPIQDANRFLRVYLVFALVAAIGCLPGANNGTGETDISGTVGGASFWVQSASADRVDGAYVVTLADTPEFACSAASGLPMNYLQIVVSDVDRAGSYEAEGRVFFNVFEDGVSEGEAATDGTITIDDIGFGTIQGAIDASGPQSDVSGHFVAEICN